MSPEAQRIAIAEAVGWRVRSFCGRNYIVPPLNPECRDPWGPIGKDFGWQDALEGKPVELLTASFNDYRHDVPPDYLSDLNAMAEAEKARMIPMGTGDYYFELEKVIERDRGLKLRGNAQLGFSGWLVHAEAPQRAEAFLRTLNLWTD